MLIRNFYPSKGLYNSIKCFITRLCEHGVKVRKLLTLEDREEFFIPRITLREEKDLPFELSRRQLPLKPCFPITMNKSQGQSLTYVGLNLRNQAFSHGQLYVGLSRVTDVNNLVVLMDANIGGDAAPWNHIPVAPAGTLMNPQCYSALLPLPAPLAAFVGGVVDVP